MRVAQSKKQHGMFDRLKKVLLHQKRKVTVRVIWDKVGDVTQPDHEGFCRLSSSLHFIPKVVGKPLGGLKQWSDMIKLSFSNWLYCGEQRSYFS